ncbi:MAG: tRNA pseudouridine(38-40) synthase TruA [Brumimicrobium sp.]|nr:tRNA pseudouridine(38-40) synthase TruA [Brumimicrobium sp.]MCO5267723.1 tRNA pseudouridine(38-40) synthase TruA [Brumimicrobium sp.]
MQFYYLLEMQYLGFRFHGWQTQPNVKTVQETILKTLRHVLPDIKSKIIASGRTDAKVSVEHTYIELFTDQEMEDLEAFLPLLNKNLPADIRALSIQPTDANFNIILAPKIKEYHYFFAFGEKFHPFCAPYMCNIMDNLDIELMKDAAKAFEGEKDFFSYAFRPTSTTNTRGEVISCEIVENNFFTASFFPKKSYVMKVKGKGFKRNQIRLMMGMLFDLGRGNTMWDDFQKTLDGSNKITLINIAPASGLQLFKVNL